MMRFFGKKLGLSNLCYIEYEYLKIKRLQCTYIIKKEFPRKHLNWMENQNSR